MEKGGKFYVFYQIKYLHASKCSKLLSKDAKKSIKMNIELNVSKDLIQRTPLEQNMKLILYSKTK